MDALTFFVTKVHFHFLRVLLNWILNRIQRAVVNMLYFVNHKNIRLLLGYHCKEPEEGHVNFLFCRVVTARVRSTNGKVLFSQVSVCSHLGGTSLDREGIYLGWGEGVPTLDGGGGTYLGRGKGVPTLDRMEEYLPWTWGIPNLDGWSLPWTGLDRLCGGWYAPYDFPQKEFKIERNSVSHGEFIITSCNLSHYLPRT